MLCPDQIFVPKNGKDRYDILREPKIPSHEAKREKWEREKEKMALILWNHCVESEQEEKK